MAYFLTFFVFVHFAHVYVFFYRQNSALAKAAISFQRGVKIGFSLVHANRI